MESQKELIHNTDWDTLIILDACRYDYFGEIYRNYLRGDLKKVESPGYNTPMWLRETFPGTYKNTIYVSGNPHINSKTESRGFNAQKHFPKILDAWDEGFDEKTGTVLPSIVSKRARKARMLNPGKRLITHFMQPHAPYLNLNVNQYSLEEVLDRRRKKVKVDDNTTGKFLRFFGNVVSKIINPWIVHRAGRVLGVNDPSPIELLAKEYGNGILRKGYKKNLEIVLGEVKSLVERLPGFNIITADHGELLGEKGLYEHRSHHPLLKKVPWLEVE